MTDFMEGLQAELAGQYRFERELGGGMSRVFLAEELSLGRRVVLKVLAPDLSHALSAERFEREMRVAAKLQHPHIVPLLSAGRAAGVLYYTMPLVEGESLRARLDQHGEFPVAEATRLFREIADALAYAHGAGLVHRDIKPDNVLLSHRHAMLTDFGVARAVTAAGRDTTLTATGMAVGTPAYMAPEQAAAAPIDHRADIYALGLVAYEMYAGHPPFNAATPQAIVAAHMTLSPPPLASVRGSITPEVAAIVHRCLEKRPADRFESADELVAALDRIPSSSSGSGSGSGQVARSPHAVSRRTLLIGGAALGVSAMGVGATLARLRLPSPPSPTYRRLTFRRGMIRTARFAPDQQTVLYGASWEGTPSRVYSVRPDSPESTALALPIAIPLAVSSTGELALSLGAHARGIMSYGTLARVPLSGGAPRELYERVKYADWTPDGRELAIIRRNGDEDQLEFPAGRVLAKPETRGGGFGWVRVSPGGDTVAAFELERADWLFGRVVVIDRGGKRRIASARFANVFGLAWRDDEVWFTGADELPLFRNALYAMNRNGETRLVIRVPGNATLHDIAPSGRILMARTDDRSGIAVRAPNDSIVRDMSWLDGTTIVGLSRDGSQLLLNEYGVGGGNRGATYVRKVDGSPAVMLAEGLGQALSPDGKSVIVQIDGESHAQIVPTGAGDTRRLARPGLTLLDARWLPDGRDVIVRARSGNAPARLHRLDLEGRGDRAITPEGVEIGADGWAVSPDGAFIAVSTSGHIDLYATQGGGADATAPYTVPAPTPHGVVIGWIERGVLTSTSPVDGGVVEVVDPRTGQRERWADIQPQDPTGIMMLNLNTLVTTPDGRGMGYSWHRAISDLYLVDEMR